MGEAVPKRDKVNPLHWPVYGRETTRVNLVKVECFTFQSGPSQPVLVQSAYIMFKPNDIHLMKFPSGMSRRAALDLVGDAIQSRQDGREDERAERLPTTRTDLEDLREALDDLNKFLAKHTKERDGGAGEAREAQR